MVSIGIRSRIEIRLDEVAVETFFADPPEVEAEWADATGLVVAESLVPPPSPTDGITLADDLPMAYILSEPA